MKTKAEVEVMLKSSIAQKKYHFENNDEADFEYTRGYSEACKWFLQPSKPIRTIFELSNKEIEKLIRIITTREIRISEIRKGCDFLDIRCMYDSFAIMPNLDFTINSGSTGFSNLIEYSDTIRKMLASEVGNE